MLCVAWKSTCFLASLATAVSRTLKEEDLCFWRWAHRQFGAVAQSKLPLLMEGEFASGKREVRGDYRNILKTLWPPARGWPLVWEVQRDSVKIHTQVAIAERGQVFVLRRVWHRGSTALHGRCQRSKLMAGQDQAWEKHAHRAGLASLLSLPNTRLQGTKTCLYVNSCPFQSMKHLWAYRASKRKEI